MREKALKADLNSFDKMFLFFTLFVVGGVIMMLELLGTRILAPFFGTTIYTWSSLITVTLFALAIGYFVGGKIADRRPDWKIIYLVIFSACLWILLIPVLRPTVLIFGNSFPLLFGSLFSAFALFTLPLFLLGMVTPFAVKLETDKLRTLGATAGSLFAVSTLGSLVGTVLTGFYLIPRFSIGVIMFLTALLLFGVVVIWSLWRRNWRSLLSFSMVFLLLTLLSFLVPPLEASSALGVVYKAESPYGQIKVVDKIGRRYLLIDNTIQAEMDKRTRESTSRYMKYVEMSTLFNPSAKDALVIGLGGGLLSNRLEGHGLRVDTVEIDPKVRDAAEEYFDYAGMAYIQDGRYFLQNTDKKYDIIIMDAFSPSSVPPHLVTLEMFKEARDHLNDGGLFVINTRGFQDSKLQKAIYLTIGQVYPEVRVYATNPHGLGNIVFFSMMNDVNFREVWTHCIGIECRILENMVYKEMDIGVDEATRILTDSYNPVEIWQREVNEESRDMMLFFFGEEVILS